MRSSAILQLPTIAALLTLTACAGSDQGLHWFYGCNAGPCGQDAGAASALCTAHHEGEACQDAGETCGSGGGCGGALVCTTSDPTTQPFGCPVSSRRFKDGIQYLSQKDLERLASSVDHIRLATYTYKGDPSARQRLGFIIEDDPQSPAVADGQSAVDLYAYTSMLVAAMKVQSQKLEQQGAELAALRHQIETRSSKPGCRR